MGKDKNTISFIEFKIYFCLDCFLRLMAEFYGLYKKNSCRTILLLAGEIRKFPQGMTVK